METGSEHLRKKAVVLLQLGGPDSPEAVEPFLYNLFCDPDIIDLPGAFLFRKILARFISSRRAPKVKELYAAIGGRSPILRQTQLQAQSLAAALASHGVPATVEIAMRYWHPLTEETCRALAAAGIVDVVLLPLYPHFSKSSTGSSVNAWNRASRGYGGPPLRSSVIERYGDHPLYIAALVERVQQALDRVPAEHRKKVHLVFSAHGTPMKLVRGGDPYSHEIRKTYALVVEQGAFGLSHHLCFQSKVGPQEWLRPSLLETIEVLASAGVSHMIVIPIAFVSDHLETLSEINIEARKHAMDRGVRYYDMTDPLLTSGKFIECLCDLVLKKMQEQS